MESVSSAYCDAITLANPRAALIRRWSPPERTKSGLIVPPVVRDRELRSSMWGKLLKVSTAPLDESEGYLGTLRDYFGEREGHYVLFNASNPYAGGLNNHHELQILAIGDILAILDPFKFHAIIVSDLTDEETSMELLKEQHPEYAESVGPFPTPDEMVKDALGRG